MKKLTVKEASFAAKIIEGLEPSAAYRASLYKSDAMNDNSIKCQAQKLLNKPHIGHTIEEGKKKLINKSIMTREEALERLSMHARIKITDICDFKFAEVGKEEDGSPIMKTVWTVKNSDDIRPEVAACIKSVSCGKDGPKIELYDSDGAIKQLSLMQGWNAAKEYDFKSSDGSMSPTRELSDDEIKEQMEVRGLKVAFDK